MKNFENKLEHFLTETFDETFTPFRFLLILNFLALILFLIGLINMGALWK